MTRSETAPMSPTTDLPPSPTLAQLLRTLIQLIADMWDYRLRFGFGPRVPALDEEASTPLLAEKDGAPVQYGREMPTGFTAVACITFRNSHSASPPQTDLKTSAEPCKSSPEQPTVSKNSPSRLDCQNPALALAPVYAHLKKLKRTTPANLPPYNPRLRAKRHAQVLKGRLLPIGDFIVTSVLAREPKGNRGNMELELCRHIAAQYWPLPVTENTHLHILEMYRNAQFMVAISLGT